MVAIEESSEAANCKGDVGVGSHCNIVETSDKGAVWHVVHPSADFGRRWGGWVGAAKLEAGHHGSIARMCVGLTKTFDDAVDEGRLGEGDGAGRPVVADGYAQGKLG